MSIKKKLSYLFFLSVLVISCSSNAGGEESSSVVKEGDSVSKVQVINQEQFKQKVFDYTANTTWKFEGDKPCVIDFYADWCAPCRQMSPLLDQLAGEYGDKINVYKINVDKERELAAAFGIQSIPAFLFCPVSGDPFGSSGMMSKEDFKKQIDSLLVK